LTIEFPHMLGRVPRILMYESRLIPRGKEKTNDLHKQDQDDCSSRGFAPVCSVFVGAEQGEAAGSSGSRGG
ncbi:MAG: hypothetical protein ABSD56_11340, partial [Bryobacteraceae bacterium]